MNVEWNWWERHVYQLFTRWPKVGLAAPMALGLAVLFGADLLVGHFGEGRLFTRDPEATVVLIAGEAAIAVVGLLSFIGMAAVMNRARYGRLLALHQTMREIRAMSWKEFEELAAAFYDAEGYRVEVVGRAGPDGGRDLVLKKSGKTLLVQCKHYRDSWVYERPLREFLGVIDNARADGGIFVCCGVFDETAVAFAANNPRLQLVAGEELRRMIVQANERLLGGRTYQCPQCGAPMEPKTGQRGAFLSCTRWPICKGSMDWPGTALVPRRT